MAPFYQKERYGMRFLKIVVLILFITQVSLQVSFAQESFKIAIISLSKVFDNYDKTKEVDKKLEKKGEKKNTERDKMVKVLNKMKDEAQLLSRDARAKKEEKIGDLMRKLQDFDREARIELRRERDDMVKDIFKEMNKVISQYGEENGYDIIFDDRVLLYSSDAIDITDKIAKLLNKGN